LRQDYPEFVERRAEIIAIGPDSADKLRAYWESEQIPFPAVPDPEKRVLDSLDQEFRWLKFGRMPAVIVAGMDGRVHLSHYGSHAGDIPEVSDVLRVIDAIPVPHPVLTTSPDRGRDSA
jgi:peroxiredoxin